MEKKHFKAKVEHLMREMSHMQEQGILCDHKIYVRNTCFPVHQLILAAVSPQLKMLLHVKAMAHNSKVQKPTTPTNAGIRSGIQKAGSGHDLTSYGSTIPEETYLIAKETRLDDIRPDVFAQIVSYMYGREVELDPCNDCELFEAADELKITHLKDIVLDFISNQDLTQLNCLRYLKFAERFNLKHLLQRSREAVAQKLDDYQESVALLRISPETLVYLLTDMFRSNTISDQVSALAMLAKWIEGNAPSWHELDMILDHVDIWRLAPGVFLEVQLTTGERGFARIVTAWMKKNYTQRYLANDLYKKFLAMGLDPVNNLDDLAGGAPDRIHFVCVWLEKLSLSKEGIHPMKCMVEAVLCMINAKNIPADDLLGLQRIFKGPQSNILFVTCWWLRGNKANPKTTLELLQGIDFTKIPPEYAPDLYNDLPKVPHIEILEAFFNLLKLEDDKVSESTKSSFSRRGSFRRSGSRRVKSEADSGMEEYRNRLQIPHNGHANLTLEYGDDEKLKRWTWTPGSVPTEAQHPPLKKTLSDEAKPKPPPRSITKSMSMGRFEQPNFQRDTTLTRSLRERTSSDDSTSVFGKAFNKLSRSFRSPFRKNSQNGTNVSK